MKGNRAQRDEVLRELRLRAAITEARAERLKGRTCYADQRPDTKPEVLAPPNPKLRFYQPASGLDRRHD